jgi:hypothetical protein
MAKQKHNYNQDYFKIGGPGPQGSDVIQHLEKTQFAEEQAREKREEVRTKEKQMAGKGVDPQGKEQGIAGGGRVMGPERSARQKSAVRTDKKNEMDANKTQKVADRQTSNKAGVKSSSKKSDTANRGTGPEPHAAPVGGAWGPGKGKAQRPAMGTTRNVKKSVARGK